MTREEAIKILKGLLLLGKVNCTQEEAIECVKMAIKALEQESILNKIRTEVIAESYPEDEESSFCKIVYLKDVLDIIDKYKEESEEIHEQESIT